MEEKRRKSTDIEILINGEAFSFYSMLRGYYVTAFGLREQTREDVDRLFLEVSKQQVIPYGKGIDTQTFALIEGLLPHQSLVAKKVHALLALGDESIDKKLATIFKKGYNRPLRIRGEGETFSLAYLISKLEGELDGIYFIPALLFYEWVYTDKTGAETILQNMRKLAYTPIATIEHTALKYVLGNLYKQQRDVVQREEGLNKEKQKEALARFSKVLGFKMEREMIIDDIFGNLEVKANKDMIEKDKRFLAQMQQVENFDETYKHPFFRHFKRMSSLPYVLGKDEMNLLNTTITRERYFYFYGLYLMNTQLERLEDTDDNFRLYFAEYLLALAYHQSLRLVEKEVEERELFRLSLEEKRLALKEETSSLEAEKQVLLKEKETHEKEKEALLEEIKALKEEREIMARQLVQKEKERQGQEKEMKALKEEVVGLREEVFHQERVVEVEEETEEDVFTYQVAYFGGHPNTIVKLRQVFPNLRHVAPEELHVDLSFVKQMDVCVFDKTYNNHSNYYRFKEAKTEVPVVYIDQGTSVGTVLRKIKEKLQ